MPTVYQVARWSEVFETAESRKYRRLPWISERTDFDSTGWQQGLDQFGPTEWCSIYGAWMVIVRVAAAGKTRGVLAGDKGEPWTAARIARPAGVDAALIQRAMDWAVSIGWLIPVTAAVSPPGDCRENLPAIGTETPEPEPGMRDSAATHARDSSAASLKLHELAKQSPLLQKLEQIPVTGSGKVWHGSVFSPDRLKVEHISQADTAFWYEWYRNQLTADSPVLRCANLTEAAFVLAAAYAAKRIPERAVKKSRLAVWISWIKTRECGPITESDWRRAAERLLKLAMRSPDTESGAPAASQNPEPPPGDRSTDTKSGAPEPSAATRAKPVRGCQTPPEGSALASTAFGRKLIARTRSLETAARE